MTTNLFYTVALSLPKPGAFLCLHWHTLESRCTWTANDTSIYTSLVESARAGDLMKHRSLGELATGEPTDSLRILPYYLTVAYGKSKKPNFKIVTERASSITDRTMVGSDQVRPFLINKRPGVVTFSADVLEKTEQLLGRPMSQDEYNSLDGRSNPALLQAVRDSQDPAPGCDLKLTVVPAGRSLRLVRNSQGEFISEIPETWV